MRKGTGTSTSATRMRCGASLRGPNAFNTLWLTWCGRGARSALTKALLKEDYGVEVELPAGKLCPTVRVSPRIAAQRRRSDSNVRLGRGLPADACR